jgi:hypothetical protein
MALRGSSTHPLPMAAVVLPAASSASVPERGFQPGP